jgi:hypothetical protein
MRPEHSPKNKYWDSQPSLVEIRGKADQNATSNPLPPSQSGWPSQDDPESKKETGRLMYDVQMIRPAHGIKMAEAGHEKDCAQRRCHLMAMEVLDNAVNEESNHSMGNPTQEVKQHEAIA